VQCFLLLTSHHYNPPPKHKPYHNPTANQNLKHEGKKEEANHQTLTTTIGTISSHTPQNITKPTEKSGRNPNKTRKATTNPQKMKPCTLPFLPFPFFPFTYQTQGT